MQFLQHFKDSILVIFYKKVAAFLKRPLRLAKGDLTILGFLLYLAITTEPIIFGPLPGLQIFFLTPVYVFVAGYSTSLLIFSGLNKAEKYLLATLFSVSLTITAYWFFRSIYVETVARELVNFALGYLSLICLTIFLLKSTGSGKSTFN